MKQCRRRQALNVAGVVYLEAFIKGSQHQLILGKFGYLEVKTH